MTHDRRLIEETFPVREVSAESAREKNIRHGHISTLHIWWARRPLASSRATAYAALVPPPETPEEWQKQRQFIIDLSKWENSLNPHILEKARRDIYQAHAEHLSAELGRPVTMDDIEAGRVPPPRVLDPFAGGGAIPLEALRLGCETYANDYNPVAVLILKATLEYPQKYGRLFEGMPADLLAQDEAAPNDDGPQMGLGLEPEPSPTSVPPDFNPLLAAVKKWGTWVLEEARKELAAFYRSPDPDETIVGYIWARTLPCQNPSCGAEIPLMRQFWLAKKKDREIALRPVVRDGRVEFEIVARGKRRGNPAGRPYAPWPEGFDPKRGTVSQAVVTCPVCGAVMDAKTTRRLFQEGQSGQRMVAVVVTRGEGRGRRGGGKQYRLPTEADLAAYAATERALAEKRERLMLEWGMDPVPTEPIMPTPSNTMGGTNRVLNYKMKNWSDLFNARQKLALITFAEKVRQAYEGVRGEGLGVRSEERGVREDFARAVATYLAFVLNKLSTHLCSLTRWRADALSFERAFDRQALPMVWDFGEVNPFSGSRGQWDMEGILEVIQHLSLTPHPPTLTPHTSHASATRLPYPDNHFDAVLTDPPYYDNVPYSYLSDFFYVWLKRTVGHLYPDLFATPLTPKGEEIVAYSHGKGGLEEGKQRFETMLSQAFREIHRVLKPDGIAVIVYAYKTTVGWETVINALLDSGLVVSGAWPLSTEMQARMNAQETASLASSIYIVARKVARKATGFYNEVREELRRHLDRKLQRLWEEGIGGADFFIAAIGSAIEVFGKYEKIMDYEGNIIRADRLLEEVRTLATDFAVRQILHNGFAGEIDSMTRFYVLWRWNFGEARAPFDEARKLAQSCGIDLAQEWNRRGTFIKKEQEFVRVLGPHQRHIEDLRVEATHASPLIDTLHRALRHWEAGEQQEMVQLLASTGYGASEVFYRVAQAISETLPIASKEKKLLDGFLAGRERVRQAVRESGRQGRLFDEI
ncbi:DUF1156 domain-containing protein [Rhodothermus profundi]|uniref:Adenine-specific DNA methylase, contains a Zn-ribbon domain n=1 Tax=Rhodothermus profundi TaxID=633813 RepID=A0A1M6UFA7_9BACT|nr:DUF1156 domain-containing protein [Rhodothermus profundi]SHK67823.1 Adenine-specific DNA methylase, contains a Zn-ribbon domain [Rhodothermus profundi]